MKPALIPVAKQVVETFLEQVDGDQMERFIINALPEDADSQLFDEFQEEVFGWLASMLEHLRGIDA